MTLDPETPPSPDDLIQHGRDDALGRLHEAAQHEAGLGDGRALRALQRLVDACGLRRLVNMTTEPDMTDSIPITLILYRDGSAEIEQHELMVTALDDTYPPKYRVVEIRNGGDLPNA